MKKDLFKKYSFPWFEVLVVFLGLALLYTMVVDNINYSRPVAIHSDCAYNIFNRVNWGKCEAPQPVRLPIPDPTPAEIRRLARKIAELNPHLDSTHLPVGTLIRIPEGYQPSPDVIFYGVNEDDAGGFSDMARNLYRERWDKTLNPAF